MTSTLRLKPATSTPSAARSSGPTQAFSDAVNTAADAAARVANGKMTPADVDAAYHAYLQAMAEATRLRNRGITPDPSQLARLANRGVCVAEAMVRIAAGACARATTRFATYEDQLAAKRALNDARAMLQMLSQLGSDPKKLDELTRLLDQAAAKLTDGTSDYTGYQPPKVSLS